MTIEVFISWSGPKSRLVAIEFAKYLRVAVPTCKPWISTHDIPSGSRWSDELSAALSRCVAAVLILTAENIISPWVLFEAGAISRPLSSSKVVPLLVDVDPVHLPAPLAQFQGERLDEDGFIRLCEALRSPGAGARRRAQKQEDARCAWRALAPRLAEINTTLSSVALAQVTRSEMIPSIGIDATPLANGAFNSGEIVSPEDFARVPQLLAVSGTLSSVGIGFRPWLLVWAPSGQMYPQVRLSDRQARWEAKVRIGRVGAGLDNELEYVVELAVAGADTDYEFEKYLRGEATSKDGLGTLRPTDLLRLDSRRVVRTG